MEEASILRAIVALAFVAALVGLMGWILRRWDISRLTRKLQEGRRLRMVEQLHLDAKRKVVLLQCDAQEYLVLFGAESEQWVALSQEKEKE